MNKLVALNVSSVCLLSLGYRSNRVITLGVSSVFLFALGVYFVGSWRRPGAADVPPLPKTRLEFDSLSRDLEGRNSLHFLMFDLDF